MEGRAPLINLRLQERRALVWLCAHCNLAEVAPIAGTARCSPSLTYDPARFLKGPLTDLTLSGATPNESGDL